MLPPYTLGIDITKNLTTFVARFIQLGWKMGFERRSRSEDTFENKYLFILATHLIYPTSTYLQMSPTAIFCLF